MAAASVPDGSLETTFAGERLSPVVGGFDTLGREFSSLGCLAVLPKSSSEPATAFGFGSEGSEFSFFDNAALREARRVWSGVMPAVASTPGDICAERSIPVAASACDWPASEVVEG